MIAFERNPAHGRHERRKPHYIVVEGDRKIQMEINKIDFLRKGKMLGATVVAGTDYRRTYPAIFEIKVKCDVNRSPAILAAKTKC